MKSNFLKAGTGLLLLTILPAVTSAKRAPFDGDKKVATYSIESLFCSGCVAGLKSVVSEIEGVVSVEVNVEEHSIEVVFDGEDTDVEVLQARITEESSFKLRFLSLRETDENES